MADGAASGFEIGEIRGVTMDVKNYVSGRIVDGRIRIRRGIVEDPIDLVIGLLGGLSLLRGNGAECNDHGGIHGNDIVK